MKKLFKTVANFVAVAALAVATLGMAACEDVKKLELDLSLYNYTDSAFYTESDVKFSVELYRHLAPKTVDEIIKHVKNGYYNDAVFYQETGYSSQIMMGDLKFENGELKQNLIDGKLPSQIYGEFENNGTTGSNLVNESGSIGLWRSWYESNNNTYKTSNAMDSGRATWFIPTAELSGYNGYFCVFAQYDKDETANAKAISAIKSILSDNSTEYVVFFTGEYDANKPDENFGLAFHAVLKADFDEDYDENENTYGGETVFTAEGAQLVCFNKRTVKIPNAVNGESSAKVKTITVK